MSESVTVAAGESTTVLVHDPKGSHEAIVRRSEAGVLSGETPVRYRLVLELDSPVQRHQKIGGTRELTRLEAFFNDPTLYYWLQVFLSRACPEGQKPWARLEAVILDEDSKVTWGDRNPDEGV